MKVLGSYPGLGSFRMELTCSPCVCVGFIPQSKDAEPEDFNHLNLNPMKLKMCERVLDFCLL